LKQKLEQKRKDLEGLKIGFVMMNRITCINSKIDLKESLKEMDFSLDDFDEFAAALIGVGLFGGWIGAIIGFLSYILRKWFFGDGGKSKAKEKARKIIEEAFRKDTTKYELLNNVVKNLNKEKNRIYDEIKEENNNIRSLGEIIDSAKEQMKNYVKTINNKKYGNI
jgi:vacuolar-type H+-ATPase subunit H